MKRDGRRKQRLSSNATQRTACVFCLHPGYTHPLRSSNDLLRCLKPFFDRRQEFVVTLSLDSCNRLIKRRVVTIGLLDVSLVGVREVFAGPVADQAAKVVVAHNHPSGIAAPSPEDIKTTKQLAAAGELLGVPVYDHLIIVADGRYYSFRENGLMV